ncbi:hypothetical protein EXIGLDRAFT_344922 [Exidia glandulosa HHB12029]|uniref:Uncharacterized protein n=1 Tax=Exidia glandulosa HHB12029 TaxID=1314781 RepID=A0A165CGV9_EXIGL|nr:hypothetical protein EXIGLDRAFT_344922 [Exidia glandulosa HHB12029]
MLSFLRRTSAADIAASLFPSSPKTDINDVLDEAEVEQLVVVDHDRRIQAKRTRSVTFEFEIEIKTEAEDDESSLASLSGNARDDSDSSRTGPKTPRQQVVVVVPTLTPEERAHWHSASPTKRKLADDDDASLSPLKMHAAQNASRRVARARKARPGPGSVSVQKMRPHTCPPAYMPPQI